jgi:hypothetical protein
MKIKIKKPFLIQTKNIELLMVQTKGINPFILSTFNYGTKKQGFSIIWNIIPGHFGLCFQVAFMNINKYKHFDGIRLKEEDI